MANARTLVSWWPLAILLALAGCGGGDGGTDGGADGSLPGDGAAPTDGGGGDMPAQMCSHTCGACAMGEVCATGLGAFLGHEARCLKICASDDDCAKGERCAALYSSSPPTPVCITADDPPRCPDRAFDPNWHCDFPPANCHDPSTLAIPFSQPSNQTCGHELVHCPNGCYFPDGGIDQAMCR
jgi:hypothetical protein